MASIRKADEATIVTLGQIRTDFSKAGLSETLPNVPEELGEFHWPTFLDTCHGQVLPDHPYATYSKEIIAATSRVLTEPSSPDCYMRWLQMQGLALVVPTEISCVMSLCHVAMSHSLEQRDKLFPELLAMHGALHHGGTSDQPPWLLGPWCVQGQLFDSVQGKTGREQEYASLGHWVLTEYAMPEPIAHESPFPHWDRFFGAVGGMHKQARGSHELVGSEPIQNLFRAIGQKPKSLFSVQCSSVILTAIAWIELRKSLPHHDVAAFSKVKPWDRILDPQPLTYNEASTNALVSIEADEVPGSDPSMPEMASYKSYIDDVLAAAWVAARSV